MGIVLSNLLNNAVKFSESGDVIRIAAGEEDESVWITVHDTGSGIDAEDLERIFDRFYRGGNARRAAIQGTGLGLSISREIVPPTAPRCPRSGPSPQIGRAQGRERGGE